MPKDTFMNLSEEKRQAILDVIIKAFAENDYNSVSISKICRQAGIAKGSFYQYFDDKEDMYKYVLGHIGTSKLKYFEKYQTEIDMSDTFDFLRMLYAAGTEFAAKNVDLFKISKQFMTLPKTKRQELLGPLQGDSDAYLENLFEQGKAAGKIRDHLDTKFLVRLITDMSNSITEHYFTDLDEADIDDGTFMRLANNMLDILEKGIGTKEAL
ncbi:TetR/AcrR family transcriptional regulator [Acidaminobacter sp. JC074]|uniref:TetR/AcrR family transcriptional regulator n=1 Tax=Acidaminobacter sp. JC074 TaxID=2530199 RepID=UPI001F0F7BC1|nr:TetR/AcrR family transcriptional regulator [Acidaminobacter sp. JC074]MCH4887984.1 TetR/AcrR family transcriptional regulator [Acidaminobacter sp. JC074]